MYVICNCLCIVVSNTSWLCESHGGCLISDRNCLPFAGTWVHPQVFGEVYIAHIVCFLYCLCFRPGSCVPNVTMFSRLSIMDFPFFSSVHWQSQVNLSLYSFRVSYTSSSSKNNKKNGLLINQTILSFLYSLSIHYIKTKS